MAEEIDLVFDSKYRELRDDFAEKYFNGAKEESCLFALALGISRNARVPKKDWSKEKQLSWTDINRLKGRGLDFEVLFEYMEIDDGGMSAKQRMDEFVTGGLKIIDQDALVDDGSLIGLKKN